MPVPAQTYFQTTRLPDGGHTKPGLPGHPGPDPVQVLLLEALDKLGLAPRTLLDLTARGGALVLDASRRGVKTTAYEMSQAANLVLDVALKNEPGGEDVQRFFGLPWDISGQFDVVCLILPAERGNALVRCLLEVARVCTARGGHCVVAGDKNLGFERYFKEVQTRFGTGEVVARHKGLRVGVLTRTLFNQTVDTPNLEGLGVAASCVVEVPRAMARLQLAVLPGVFAAGKLDAASRLLLQHLPPMRGKRVLDIGAGCGVLGAVAALEGASVTLLENDAVSVAASQETLRLNGVAGTVLHSDVDSALAASAQFDLILTNPPFHVGKDLILDVAQEFVRAATRHVAKNNGELWLVANHFLPYHHAMQEFGAVTEVVRHGGFRVLRAANSV